MNERSFLLPVSLLLLTFTQLGLTDGDPAGPGHGAPAILSCLFLEGSITHFYPKYSLDAPGLEKVSRTHQLIRTRDDDTPVYSSSEPSRGQEDSRLT